MFLLNITLLLSVIKIILKSTERNNSEPELGEDDKSNEHGRFELVDEGPAAEVQESLIPGNKHLVEEPNAVPKVQNFTSSKKGAIVENNTTAQC